MNICHVTAHLPPDQAANALLPLHLGAWAQEAGDSVTYLAYPPRALASAGPGQLADAAAKLPGLVTWIPPRRRADGLARILRVASVSHAVDIRRTALPSLESADVVHIHSNGLLPEVVALQAAGLGKPIVLTLYGTEIWHYEPHALVPSLFTRMYRRANGVTFYSQGLLDRARELGLGRDGLSVVYPPVAEYFARRSDAERDAARRELGLTRSRVLINVKRLHPLAGQTHLLAAMPAVLRAHPDTQLVFCGTGPEADALASQAAALGIRDRVTFAGLVGNQVVARYQAAADAFVLPSLLEACPTVAVEALACGTPVISSDNPGGVELHRIFGDDVDVVPREDAGALAAAIVSFLNAPRRTRPSTDEALAREFRPSVCAGRYREIYRRLLAAVRQR